MELKNRKSTRIKEYNYASSGAYFLTICTQDRMCTLSKIVLDENEILKVRLTPLGELVEEQLLFLESRYDSFKLDNYVIMPNHIHILCTLLSNESEAGGASPSPTITQIICAFKSLVSRIYGKQKDSKLFQRSFYDHIIRNEADFLEVWDYIDANPFRWNKDKLYKDNV